MPENRNPLIPILAGFMRDMLALVVMLAFIAGISFWVSVAVQTPPV